MECIERVNGMISFRSVIFASVLLGLISGCSTSESTEMGSPSVTPATTSESTRIVEGSTQFTESNVSAQLIPPLAVKNAEDALILKNSSESLVHLEWKPYGPDVILPMNFGKDKVELIFGLDHPNGTKILAMFPEESVAWPLDISMADGASVFDDYGEITENYKIQATQYDFDDDRLGELIIAVGDGLTDLNVWVFSYTHVDNVKKINPFLQELATTGQSNVLLDKNEILFPYGSQGLFDSYKYVDQMFMKPVN